MKGKYSTERLNRKKKAPCWLRAVRWQVNSQNPCLFSFSLFARNTDLKPIMSVLSLREIIRYLCFSITLRRVFST